MPPRVEKCLHRASIEQHDAGAHGQDLARINHHQHEATGARFTVFRALAAVGIGHEQADDSVSKLGAGAVTGAHTWISESSPSGTGMTALLAAAVPTVLAASLISLAPVHATTPAGAPVINNRTARICQKDNYFGRHA
ncbi:hypothetical protein ACWER6_33845 [Streptomyces sp. NPDC004009]